MDERDELVLTTEYETMSTLERFRFAGPDVRLRTSTVQGLSNTASFCVETRLRADGASDQDATGQNLSTEGAPGRSAAELSPLGW